MSSDLLSPNATTAERALALTVARLSDVPVPVATLWNPATCPAAVLPWLAWALSVDHWDTTWSETVNRAKVAESLRLHATKGTPAAVEQAVVVAGAPNARVVEWWEYAGDPYHFSVEVDLAEDAVTVAIQEAVESTIAAFKNVRSVCDGVAYNLSSAGAVPAWAIGLQSSEVVTVYL